MPPKPRSAPKRQSTTGRDTTQYLWIVGGVALVVVGILVFVLVGRGGDTAVAAEDAKAALKTAGCTVQTVKSLPSNDHSIATPEGTSKKWNTNPPTSGPHYAQWVRWGAYTSPVNLAQVVHNLEHGGIYILYGEDVPQSTVSQLTDFYYDHQNGTVLAPYPELGDKIALGAWVTKSASTPDDGNAYLAKCTAFDRDAFAAFFGAFHFQGPERFPSSQLTPGS
jgi:uncharacterized protein DUF3105